MRTLILFGLCVLATLCNADSSESNEIDDVLFLGRGDAYSFMRPVRPPTAWNRPRSKSMYEVNREQCEEYPCDHLMRPIRRRPSYNRFLGGGWMYHNNHRQNGYRSRKHYYYGY